MIVHHFCNLYKISIKPFLLNNWSNNIYCLPLDIYSSEEAKSPMNRHRGIYSLKSITVAYNNSLRILLNLPSRCSASFMFATNYIKSFNERIRSSIFSLLCRLHQSDNILFINYLHTDIHFKSHMYSCWRSLLYTCH